MRYVKSAVNTDTEGNVTIEMTFADTDHSMHQLDNQITRTLTLTPEEWKNMSTGIDALLSGVWNAQSRLKSVT